MWWQEWRLVHMLITFTWLVNGLVINLVQLTLHLTLGRVSRDLFRKINFYAISGIYGYLLSLMDWWSGAEMLVYCDDELATQLGEGGSGLGHCLVTMNHHTEIDWLYCWKLASFADRLGNCRAFAKSVLKFVPVIGWSSYLSEDVYLARSWDKDKDEVDRSLQQLETFPSPVWLFLFPEGTRLTADKLKASQEFASTRGLPDLEYHLTPRTRGFAFTLSQTGPRGRMTTLLDLTVVPISGSAPLTMDSLFSGRPTKAMMFARRFKIADLPQGEKEAGEWLINLFKEKDLIKKCALSGDLEPLKQVDGFTLEPRTFPCPQWTQVLFLLTNLMVIVFIILFLASGSTTTWVVFSVGLVVMWFASNSLVSVSKIKQKKDQ